MSDITKLNNDLISAYGQIEIKSNELETARENHLLKKAQYENEFSKIILLTKVKNPDMAQGDLKATAICICYELQLDSIKSEAKYKRLLGDIKSLRDKLDSLKEIGYNLRREIKSL
ncbi:MAG: hypothetical protein PHH73_00020 [Candidatus Rickettsiella isopodorum]|nr:hypothetical protein [Candidatus Rickettsiella isopodorum]